MTTPPSHDLPDGHPAHHVPRKIRVLAAGVMLLVAGALAGTAYTRDASAVVAYNCEDGDRFTVEYRQGHVRLRHGTGVFLLGKDESSPDIRFSDGHLILHTSDQSATLEPSGPSPRGICHVIDA